MKKIFQDGFTLVELLVGIAVLAIIASVVVIGIDPIKKINVTKDAAAKSDISQIVNALQRRYSNAEKLTYPESLDELKGNELKNVPNQQSGAFDCSGTPSSVEAQEYCYAVNAEGTAAAVWGTTWGKAETSGTGGAIEATASARMYYWCWDSTTGTYKALTESPTTVPSSTDPVCPATAASVSTPTPTSALAILTQSPTPTTPAAVTPTPTLTPTPTPTPTLTPTPTPTITPTPIPCSTSTSPSVINLITTTTDTITAIVTGLGTATVNQMRFGSYNPGIATVNPTSDASSPYSTIITALTAGNTAVWATADLSDGRFCQSTGTTDTDINVVFPSPTPTRTPTPTPPRPPTGTISGPSTITLGGSGTYTATVNDADNNQNLAIIYVEGSPAGTQNWTEIKRVSCSGAPCTTTASWTPSTVGTYTIVVNGHDNTSYQCSGNPYYSSYCSSACTGGYTRCGAAGTNAGAYIVVTVTSPPLSFQIVDAHLPYVGDCYSCSLPTALYDPIIVIKNTSLVAARASVGYGGYYSCSSIPAPTSLSYLATSPLLQPAQQWTYAPAPMLYSCQSAYCYGPHGSVFRVVPAGQTAANPYYATVTLCAGQ
jgi:prepilin-type N-terminal cleavage/methylation domain-containing protein